jgi:hypothetical protein
VRQRPPVDGGSACTVYPASTTDLSVESVVHVTQRQIPEEVLYDERLIDRHIKAGFITRKDVENHRNAAADLTDQAASLEIESAPKKQK